MPISNHISTIGISGIVVHFENPNEIYILTGAGVTSTGNSLFPIYPVILGSSIFNDSIETQ